jgi:hypothetical protein
MKRTNPTAHSAPATFQIDWERIPALSTTSEFSVVIRAGVGHRIDIHQETARLLAELEGDRNSVRAPRK